MGGLYACGYTPAEMMELINSDYFGYLSSGRPTRRSRTISPRAARHRRYSPCLSGGRDSTARSKIFNPQSLRSPMPASFGFMQIFSAYGAQCDGQLRPSFRAVPLRGLRRRAETQEGNGRGRPRRSRYAPPCELPLIFRPPKSTDRCSMTAAYTIISRRRDADRVRALGNNRPDVSAPPTASPTATSQQLDLLVSRAQAIEPRRKLASRCGST